MSVYSYLLFLTDEDSRLKVSVSSNPEKRVSLLAAESGKNLSVRYAIPYSSRAQAESRKQVFHEVFKDYRETAGVSNENKTVSIQTSWYKPEILERLRMDEAEMKEKIDNMYYCHELSDFSLESFFPAA